jgi:hypothetical protein
VSGLQTQIVPIDFTQGMDTKSDNKVGVPGDLVDLRNLTFQNTEKLTKRNGYSALTPNVFGGGTLAAGAALATRGGELLLADGTNLYSYSSGPITAAWVNKGPLLSPTVSYGPALSSQYSLAGYDCAVTSNGLMCVAAEQWTQFQGTNKGVIYSVIDITTGNLLLQPTLVNGTTSTCPKVISASGYFLIYYLIGGVLRVTQISQAGLAIADGAVTSNVGANNTPGTDPNYDAMFFNGSVYVAFINANATNGITVYKTTAATPTTIAATISTVPGASLLGICIFGNRFNNDVVVGALQGAGVANMVAYDSGLAGTTKAYTQLDATTQMSSITGVSLSAGATSLQFFTAQFGASSLAKDFVRQVAVTGSYSIGSASTVTRGATIAGKATQINGVAYVPLSFCPGQVSSGMQVVSPQCTWFLSTATGAMVVRALSGSFSGTYANNNWQFGNSSRQQMLPETNLYGTGVVCPAGVVTQYSAPLATSGQLVVQTGSVGYLQISITDPTNQYISTTLANTTLFSGGLVTSYDGGQSASGSPAAPEHGFNYYPYGVSIATGGGTAGTYQYVVCYEWTDANGLIQRSAPSVAVSTTNLGGTLTIPTYRLTQKSSTLRGGVQIVVYRTISNGSIFYRANNTGSSSDALYNDPTVDTVTYADNLADTNLSANAQLYTTGGVLQNYAPNPLASVVTHRNRMWGIDTTSPLSLWYSKQVIQSTSVAIGGPVEFSAYLTFNVDPRGGPCTGLASLDDKLIIFKASSIFAVTGQGPDSTGGQNDFSDAILVSSDAGCIAPKSIVLCAQGIMFQSRKGIYLLGRDLSVQYIGANVEQYNGNPVVGAVLVPATNQVRMMQSAQQLVWDYFQDDGKKHLTWDIFAPPGTEVGAVVWNNAVVYLDSTGRAWVETAGQYYDVDASNAKTYIAPSILTSFISLQGLQGFQRVRKLLLVGNGTNGTADTVTVTLWRDYDGTAPFQTVTFTPTVAASGNWQQRIDLSIQKMESLQVKIATAQTSTNQPYFDITAMTLEVAGKGGIFRLPAAQSSG